MGLDMILDILTVSFFLGGALGMVFLIAERRGDVLNRPRENLSHRPRARLGDYKFGSKRARKRRLDALASLGLKRNPAQLHWPEEAARGFSQQCPAMPVGNDTAPPATHAHTRESTARKTTSLDEWRSPASPIEMENGDKGRKVEINAMISTLKLDVLELEQKIRAEEAESGIGDPSDAGYSMIAKVMTARRDKLNDKRAALEHELAGKDPPQTEALERAA
jgi:hypothetical protein